MNSPQKPTPPILIEEMPGFPNAQWCEKYIDAIANTLRTSSLAGHPLERFFMLKRALANTAKEHPEQLEDFFLDEYRERWVKAGALAVALLQKGGDPKPLYDAFMLAGDFVTPTDLEFHIGD